ncbi:MAG: hypothetical protein KBA97_04830 [Methanothrix sp.]|jgi:hypothetical protein|nr:hypothetical protein [Methanothrix sp.]
MDDHGCIEITLTFLEKTKQGTYAPIDDASIPYVRLGEVTEIIEAYDPEYYYSTA